MQSWLTHRLHVSWLIAWVATAILCGIGLAAIFGARYVTPGVWAIAGCVIFIAACIKRVCGVIVFVLFAGLLIGLWRGEVEQAGLAQYKNFYGKIVAVQGIVSDDTALGPGGDQRLSIGNVTINGTKLNSQVWVSTDSSRIVERSDEVIVRGKLGFGFGSVAASMFHATLLSDVRPQPGDIGLHVRDWFAGGIRTAIPEPEASLASGYLVGRRSTLPSDLDAQLKTVGLTHAVVASGYNLTILVSIARQLLAGVSKYLATFVSVLLMAGFIAMSGATPSMVRAGLVTSLSLAAWYYGRKLHPLVLLPLAAAITALINPFYVWGDIGWYLSFTSFAGVIILAPVVQHALWRGREKVGIVAQVIVDTLCAQVATLPIMVMAFGHYSPYALLANILVLPLVPLTMLLTFIAGSIGLLAAPLAHFSGLPADLILRYMIWIVSHIADLPGAEGTLSFTGLDVILCYAALGILTIILWLKTGYDFRRSESTRAKT